MYVREWVDACARVALEVDPTYHQERGATEKINRPRPARVVGQKSSVAGMAGR